MKTFRIILMAALLFVTACAPIFHEEIMRKSTLNPSLAELNAAPANFEGRMFIFGGRIINTRSSEDGTAIEAAFLPVDSLGYVDYGVVYSGRFMAFMPENRGVIDPMIFLSGRLVSIAGIYKGVRTSMIDKTEYSYSYFEIVDLRLWAESALYIRPLFYAPYPSYYWYGPGYYYPR